jgi:hypothetical protein
METVRYITHRGNSYMKPVAFACSKFHADHVHHVLREENILFLCDGGADEREDHSTVYITSVL